MEPTPQPRTAAASSDSPTFTQEPTADANEARRIEFAQAIERPTGIPKSHNISDAEASIIAACATQLPNSEDIKSQLQSFVETASKLNENLSHAGELHCFVVVNDTQSGAEERMTTCFPVFSKLVHRACNSSRPGARHAAQAFSDAFQVASLIDEQISPNEKPSTGDQLPTKTNFDLPKWFPWLNETRENSTEHISIPIDDAVMQALLKCSSVSEIYGDFFGELFEKGRSMKKVSGRIKYSTLTPRWLRARVAFIHGANKNELVTCLDGELPSKSVVRRNNLLACAILATWFEREIESSELLKHVSLTHGVLLESSR